VCVLFVETDRNQVLHFRPKTKPTPKVEAYFRSETDMKRNCYVVIFSAEDENETNVQDADEVRVTYNVNDKT